MAGAEVDGEQQLEPFLTINVHEGTSGCNAEIPEFGIELAARTPDEARRSLMAIVVAQSRAFVELESDESTRLKYEKVLTPERLRLARRVLEVPQERLAEIFR